MDHTPYSTQLYLWDNKIQLQNLWNPTKIRKLQLLIRRLLKQPMNYGEVINIV